MYLKSRKLWLDLQKERKGKQIYVENINYQNFK